MQSTINRISIALLCLITVSASSCKKFLSDYSQNKSYISTATDLEEILVGDGYYNYTKGIHDIFFAMDDDAEIGRVEVGNPIPTATGFHFWQAEPRMDINGTITNTDVFYTEFYNKIARINTILESIPGLRDDGQPAAALNKVSGEAHFLRAYYYFMLVNLYGKPYKPSTASTDFGVPLKTAAAVTDQFATRSTAKQVYDQIILDLLEAEKELAGVSPVSTIRANQAAAQALLSRVYLFTEAYDQAALYADKVINTQRYPVTDLNNYVTGNDFLTRSSPEVIFTMGGSYIANSMSIQYPVPSNNFYRVSDDLAMSYSQEDLRKQAFYIQSTRGYLRSGKKRKSVNATTDDVSDRFLLRMSEIYLNKAEALTALGQYDQARNSLQELRKNRFKPAELPALSAEGSELMDSVRLERRRELSFEMHRWFDLRRYAVNGKYPYSKTIRHKSYATSPGGFVENGYYELGTYDQDAAAYIVPIANDEIEFNQGRLTNEPRPQRPLKQ